jgi:hypothetical protein
LYSADTHAEEYFARCSADQQPVMTRYRGISWPEIVSIPLEQAVRDELQYYRERFCLILEELNSLGEGGPMLLEGADFLPELMQSLALSPAQVFYLVPSAEFQRTQYRQRPWIQPLLAQCPDPEAAFTHWMARETLFATEVIAQARQLGYHWQIVDGSLSLAQIYGQVCTYFSLLDEHPYAKHTSNGTGHN